MQLFYQENITETTTLFSFDTSESKHITKVLRKKEDDILHLTNGKGYLFTTKITDANPKKCIVKIIKSEQKPAKNYYLHLVVAPTKNNERYEWFLEKVTEIGVHEITPIICEHSERKIIKPERFKKIIQTALKQSLHYYLPKFNDAISYKNFLKQDFDGQLFIAHCKNTERKTLKRKALADHKITILIGPEGDFSDTEVKLAIQKGFIPVSLGKHRLRTETAAIVACNTVALSNE